MWIALLVCLSVGAFGAEVADTKREVVMLEIETEPRDKRTAFPDPYPSPYAYPGAAEASAPASASYPRGVGARATFGAAPGQYVVRTGGAPQQQQQQQQEEISPEFLQGLYQQLAAQQQQDQQQEQQQDVSQPAQQPLIQQLVVSRAPHVPQARVISHDSRYDQQPQTQILQPRRQPATPRPPTEQQLLQQNFFQTNQLQGTLRSVSQARPNPTPPGASVFHDLNAAQAQEIHQARLQASLAGQDPNYAQAPTTDEAYQQLRLAEQQHSEQQQLASLRAQSQQFYSQSPQAFPQPTAPAPAPPARRPAASSARPTYQPIADAPEQYLRETSPPIQQQQQQPLLVSLSRGQLQVQASPDQNVYYTSSQPQPSPTPSAYLRPQQQSPESAAELTAYLRQQHQQQQQAASPSAAPQYIQHASPSAAPQYIQQASPSAAPQYIQQASPSPSPAAFVQQYQRQPTPSATPAYIQQLRSRPSPSPSASPSPSYIQQYRPQPSPVPSYIQLQQATPSASADPSAYLRQQQVNAAVSPNAYQQVESATPTAPIYRTAQSSSDPTIYQSSERPQYQSPSAAPAFRRPQVVANPEYVQPRPETPSYFSGQQSEDPESQDFVSSLLSQQPGRSIFDNANRNEAALRLLKSPTTPTPSRSSIYVSTSANRSPKNQVIEEQIQGDSRSNALPVVRLPTPKGQRPLTQSEYQALVAAGFNITPVDEKGIPHEVESSPSQQAFYQSSPKYQRSYVTAAPPVNQLSQTTKLQQVQPQEGYEAIVVPEDQPKVARRRPGARRVRYQTRPAYAAEEQQQVPVYESYDSVPAAATNYSSKRRVRGRRQEVTSDEQES